MPKNREKNIKLIRGLLGPTTGDNDKLIITKKGVIYLKPIKNKKR